MYIIHESNAIETMFKGKRIHFGITEFDEIINEIPNYFLEKDLEEVKGIIYCNTPIKIKISNDLKNFQEAQEVKFLSELNSEKYNISPNPDSKIVFTANREITKKFYNSGEESVIMNPKFFYSYPSLNIFNNGLILLNQEVYNSPKKAKQDLEESIKLFDLSFA